MGMFDSVIMGCPCGGEIEWQSNAGERVLARYHPSSVPFAIAADVSGRAGYCEGCGKSYILRLPFGGDHIAMIVYDD